MAQESLRSIWNYDDVLLLGPTDTGSSLGSFMIHPFSEKQQTSKVRVMLSLSCLLFIGLPSSAPSHGSNYGSERWSSSFPYPRHPNQALYCTIPATAGRYFLRRKKEECQVQPTEEKKKILLLSVFPLSFGLWFYWLLLIQLSSISDQHFYLQPKFPFQTSISWKPATQFCKVKDNKSAAILT